MPDEKVGSDGSFTNGQAAEVMAPVHEETECASRPVLSHSTMVPTMTAASKGMNPQGAKSFGLQEESSGIVMWYAQRFVSVSL